MALAEPGDGEVAWSSFSRTPRGGAVSVRAMRDFLRKRVFGFIHGDTDSTLASFIRSHLVGEGGYSPKAREKQSTFPMTSLSGKKSAILAKTHLPTA
jgi:hypothetical protein